MLTRQKRRIFFYLSIAAFLILLFPVLLYSLGYGITGDFTISKTGGIYIKSSVSGAAVMVNGKTKHTSLLGYSAIIKNLIPGNYNVLVEKDGYWKWEKVLRADAEAVTSRNALLISKNISGRIIPPPPLLTKEGIGEVKTPPYPSIKKYWKLSSGDFLILGEDKKFYKNRDPLENGALPEEAQSTLAKSENSIFIDRDQRIIFWEGRNIDSLWIGDIDAMPQWQGEKEIGVFTSPPGSKILAVLPYPGWPDYLITAFSNGVFALDMDSSDKQNIFPIYKGKMPEIVSIESGKLILKDDGNFIEIELP